MNYAFGEANRPSDDLLQLATHGSLDTKTFLSLGMNRKALTIFVARLESVMPEKTNDANLLEIAAKERLKLANLTYSLSKSWSVRISFVIAHILYSMFVFLRRVLIAAHGVRFKVEMQCSQTPYTLGRFPRKASLL